MLVLPTPGALAALQAAAATPHVEHAPAAADGFLPHGYCYLWNKPLLWTHLTSDLLIGVSYVVISFALVALVHRARKDIPFHVLFVAFGLFIITCGFTHFMEIWTLWRPVYWLAGGVKAVTAMASVATAAAMPFMIPRVHDTIRDAKRSRERELAAARADALAEQNVVLTAQARELTEQRDALARQREEARTLAAQLEVANAELRRLAAEARRHLGELEATYQSAPVGLCVLDAGLRFVRVNERLAEMNGRAAAAHVGRTVGEMVPALAASVEPALRRVLETGEPVVGIEISGETAADPGVVHHWVETWHPLRDAAGAVSGINVVAEDVTARRAAEAARQASDARFRAMVEAAPQLAWSNHPDGAVEFFNARWSEFTGVGPAALAGDGWEDVVHPDDRGATRAARERANARGEPYELELRFRRHDGVYRWHLARVVPVRDAAGAVLAWYGAAADIEERKREADTLARTVDELQHANARLERLAADLRFANEEMEAATTQASAARVLAEQASAAKSAFLATMSHELRTPLNAVLGYVDLLEVGVVGPVTGGQRGYLDRVRASARHLLGLINEILDLTRVEAGQVAVDLGETRPRREAREALNLVRPQAEAKQLALTLDGPDVRAVADPDRVRQILVNLLANAVRFTAAGGRVAVRVDLVEPATGEPSPLPPTLGPHAGPWVRMEVADSGVGIPPERLEAIFDPFVQVPSGDATVYTRQHGGTGLGLTIARRLARLMRGDLTVSSAPGQGSTFTLWLPAPPAPAVAAAGGAPAPRSGAAVPAPAASHGSARAGDPRAEQPEVGRMLIARAGDIATALAARLRDDPAVPGGAATARVDLEDHLATLLTDLGQGLAVLDAPSGDRAALVADGVAVQTLVAERHGHQRRRLGWDEAALAREAALLREEVTRAIRSAAPPTGPTTAYAATADDLAALADLLVEEAMRVAVRAFRARSDPGTGPAARERRPR